ncbi:MAG: phosphoglycerate kinase [SAR86 cluster bacterium]|uniref:Phosphoglycerate kinase n=1 Tax=SAR86 cluster bacterium TaxID=2030880 RepID=A0A520N6H1_9GAMM|nr:MAG: phosphoglycerate kinase [SAR86 cluster bacterium]|tara:strand:+ start:668 stop:1822 length:1155 start_codon:yes stop_codon:yes gene_type:complete
MINLSSEEITSKNLVIRVDMNVPIKDGIVLDSTRIEACIPTIMFALNRGARILLISHLGRPTEGSFDEKFSLKPVAESLSKIINMSCEVINDIESEHIFKSESVIQVLENIRFFKGEKENCKDLGYKLANLGDIYVFDAFGTAHREQASTHAAIEHASIACAGLLMEKENKFLSQALDSFKAPYIAIIGGAKVSSKLELIKHINSVADHIIVGGGIANTFLKAAGLNVGKSLVEDSMLDIAKELIEEGKIVLPRNVTTSKLFEGKDIKEKSVNEITEEEMILDLSIEEKTLSLINDAKTILWNGPVGVFENDLFAEGTRCLSKAISKSEAFSLAGGGETLSAINKYINPDDVSYCSTGGGAFLEFMEGKTLPSIKALNLKEIRS